MSHDQVTTQAKFILIVDTEGLRRPREIAGILFDLEAEEIVQQFATLIPHQMTDAMKRVKTLGSVNYERRSKASKQVTRYMLDQAFAVLNQMIDKCDVIVAHNAYHDRKVLSTFPDLKIQSKPWLCTRYDFKWPGKFSLKLINIASNMGVKVFRTHIALDDCHTLLECMKKHPNFKQVVQEKFSRTISWENIENEIETDDEKQPITVSDSPSPVLLGKRKHWEISPCDEEFEKALSNLDIPNIVTVSP